MGDKSGIQWTDATWNPVTGCTKVSPGCAHCYAETVAQRFWPTQCSPIACEPNDPRTKVRDAKRIELLGSTGVPGLRFREFTDVQCYEDRLDQPLRWTRPRRIFVNSMSDLFHEAVPDAFIDRVFAVMALAPQHTFQVLTKRADRMRAYLTDQGWHERVGSALWEMHTDDTTNALPYNAPPLPNVWLGVSVENQHFADERIPLLLQTPAAVRFISAEPLLGPINLREMARVDDYFLDALDTPDPTRKLDWVIVGGESGPKARPFDVAWARSIVQQCQTAGVPVFVKQLGAKPFGSCRPEGCGLEPHEMRFTDRKGGDPNEWPEDLRVRQFPGASEEAPSR